MRGPRFFLRTFFYTLQQQHITIIMKKGESAQRKPPSDPLLSGTRHRQTGGGSSQKNSGKRQSRQQRGDVDHTIKQDLQDQIALAHQAEITKIQRQIQELEKRKLAQFEHLLKHIAAKSSPQHQLAYQKQLFLQQEQKRQQQERNKFQQARDKDTPPDYR